MIVAFVRLYNLLEVGINNVLDIHLSPRVDECLLDALFILDLYLLLHKLLNCLSLKLHKTLCEVLLGPSLVLHFQILLAIGIYFHGIGFTCIKTFNLLLYQ